MILDCHAHLISDDHEKYPVAPLSGEVRPGDLDNPITAERLLREMDACGVEHAMVVQRAHIYGYDNRYIVDSAARYSDRLSAVCMIDGLDPGVGDTVRFWVGEKGATSIRMSEPRKGADMSWFAGDAALSAWNAANDLGISLRLHLYRWNRLEVLAALVPILKQFPNLPVIVDHLSNIVVESGPPDFGVDAALLTLQPFTNVRLMYSSINLAKLRSENQASAPVIKRVVEVFGADRVMWGSDIGQTKGTYAEMTQWAVEAAADLSKDDAQQVLYGTTAALR